MSLFWHRRDLRTRDDIGLHAATNDGPAVPVYVYDPDVVEQLGSRQRAFLMRGVRALKARYRDLGSDLVVRGGSAESVLPDLVAEYDAETVYCVDHYRPVRRNQTRRVREALDVALDSRTDHVLVDPARLDDSYRTHSQFHDDWTEVPKPTPFPEPDAADLVDVADGKTVPEYDVDVDLPEAGYEAARDRLDDFVESGIRSYNDTRDDLKLAAERPTEAVSRMSPYLAAGNVGVREVWAVASDAYQAATGRERKNVGKYRYELSWREHNYHLLYHNPDLLVENYDDPPNEIAWRNDADDLAAWRAGETGFPLVDAGMRQLNQEGYVHNRPRQVVASFLTRHLLVDWRVGAKEFREKLVDHDPASNTGSWQWIAGTGTDSVDVRIFDPVSQMAKYDEDATFVKRYVPELRDVPPGKVVDWPTLSRRERERLAPEYPHPIVDRNDGYDRAQRVFEEALGKR
ncbi:MAG: deoxyribodipyrimidine photo-lyase [Halolamina sp.]